MQTKTETFMVETWIPRVEIRSEEGDEYRVKDCSEEREGTDEGRFKRVSKYMERGGPVMRSVVGRPM